MAEIKKEEHGVPCHRARQFNQFSTLKELEYYRLLSQSVFCQRGTRDEKLSMFELIGLIDSNILISNIAIDSNIYIYISIL